MNRDFLKSTNPRLRSIGVQPKSAIFFLIVALTLLCSSCTSHLGTLWSPSTDYTVGGTVTGLTGTGLVLQDDSGNNLSVSAGATSFSFGRAIASGGNYNVTVLSQPSTPTQSCAVTNGNGTITNANITSVQVSCTTNSYTIGGTISGLTGSGLVLQDNSGNNLSVSAGATAFTFSTPIASGANYNVTVLSDPSNPTQNCIVGNGSGTVTNANITSVQVSCTTNSYTIGGTISGLTGTGLVLQDNGGNNLSVSAGATTFTFSTPIVSGGSYSVTVFSQPSNPTQTCIVTSGTGPITNANITSVQVSCTTSSYTIGGTISGLTGAGLVLQDNGGNNLSVSAGATSFTFSTAIASGGSYSVTVFSQPSNPAQTCNVTNGTGTVTNANIATVQVSCTTNSYTIGGTISGLTGTGLVLQDNSGDNLSVSAGATTFTFSTAIASGGAYNVTIFSEPSNPSQNCAVSNGNGIVATADVTNILITCAASTQLFAYATNENDNTVTAFKVLANGALQSVPGSPFYGGLAPDGAAADPSGKFLYVANIPSDAVSGYLIAADGSLQPMLGSPFPTASGPVSVTIDPTGRFAYVSNCGSDCSGVGAGAISAFTIGGTGDLTPVTGSPFAAGTFPYQLAMQSTASFAYTANDGSNNITAYAIQQPTGGLVQIAGSPFFAGTRPLSVAVNPQNNLLFAANTGSSNVSVFTINSNGSLSAVPGSPFSTGPATGSVTVDLTGSFVYVTAGAGVYGFSIGSSGALTPIPGSPFVAGSVPQWITIDPTNHFLYVSNYGASVSGYTIDQATGELTAIPGSPFAAGNLTSSIVVVSVPQ